MAIVFDDAPAPVRSRVKFDDEAPPAIAAPAPQSPSLARQGFQGAMKIPGVGLLQSAAESLWNSAAKVPAGLAGLAGSLLPGEEGQGTRWTEGVRNALSVDPTDTSGDPIVRGMGAGMQAGEKLLAPVTKPADEWLDKHPNTQALLGGGLEAFNDITNVVGTGAGLAAARAPTTAARSAIRDSTEMMGARAPEEVASAAGFQVRPSDIQAQGGKTTRTQRTAERLGGGAPLRRDAIMNQLERTEALTREELGIPAGTAINKEALAAVEAPHAAAYNAIEAIPNIGFDKAFTRQVSSIGSDNPLTATPPSIKTLQDEILSNEGASGLNLRKKISDLRQQARDNLATGGGEQLAPRDRTLGGAQLKMANALEDVLERNVAPEQLAAYREARKVFAQTNMIRRANTLGDRVDPNIIRDEARVNPSISGRFKIIADSAEAYPKVFSGSVPELSTGQGAGMMARMGSGALVGATGGGTLFGLPGAIGGAVGGSAIPWAARRLLGPGKAVADIEKGAPLYFRKSQAPARQPATPPEPPAPGPAPRGPTGGAPPAPPTGGRPTGSFSDLMNELQQAPPEPIRQPFFGPEDEFPGGVSDMLTLQRGVPEGIDPWTPQNRAGGLWLSDEATGEASNYGPNVGTRQFAANDFQDVGTVEGLRALVQGNPDMTVSDLMVLLSQQQDRPRGVTFTRPPEMDNPAPREYFRFADDL